MRWIAKISVVFSAILLGIMFALTACGEAMVNRLVQLSSHQSLQSRHSQPAYMGLVAVKQLGIQQRMGALKH